MLQLEVLIFKLVAIDGLSTCAIVVGEVTALAHEVWDDSVESASLVSKTFFTGAQSTEVLSCLWDNISSQLQNEGLHQ